MFPAALTFKLLTSTAPENILVPCMDCSISSIRTALLDTSMKAVLSVRVSVSSSSSHASSAELPYKSCSSISVPVFVVLS